MLLSAFFSDSSISDLELSSSLLNDVEGTVLIALDNKANNGV